MLQLRIAGLLTSIERLISSSVTNKPRKKELVVRIGLRDQNDTPSGCVVTVMLHIIYVLEGD